ncbi:Sugar isomerase (SIS) [Penicillium longicatenatum]|uniref:Sugar isomerase (SIS) n=1 Tax=Penicillium longicatenatum TaxID=1561947 RepID=UPI00254775D9|nr:Sugar isomerase (SIS) [Penicillium longicatenatum]KAJ5650518.1 Sugar isomerase (SIS) [Penicillium longicatenatum]
MSTPPWPLTPPDVSEPPPTAAKDVSSIVTAIHVMSTERAALSHLERLYQTDARAQQELARAVDQIARSVRHGGKLVVCGVGKSGKIGRKIEATMNSLGIYSAFLHPTEALHGDLGLVRPNDTMLLISFSGRSPEILSMLPHIPTSFPIIALTSHTDPLACPLLSLHGPSGLGILLPAPIHEGEEASLGVSAPTSSTTVAMCLGDALAIATARKLHTMPGKGPADVFRSHHPGGAIGAATAAAAMAETSWMTPSSASTTTFDSPSSSMSLQWEDLNSSASIPPFTLQPPPVHRIISSDLLVPLDQIPTVVSATAKSPGDIRLLDILLAAIQHPNARSWVFLSPTEVAPPRLIRSLLSRQTNVDLSVAEAVAKDPDQPLTVARADWCLVPDSTPLAELRRLISTSRTGSSPITVIAVMKDIANPSSCVGVVEAEDVWGE